MNRNYECMLLLDNREVRQGWQVLKDAVNGLFAKHGAKVLSSRRWDERRLAYPIRRHQRATYLLVYFASDTPALAALRRELELSEVVLRHVMRVCEQVPAEAYEPEAAFDETAIRDEGPIEPEVAEASEEEASDDDAGDDGETASVGAGDDKDNADETATAGGE